MYCLYLSSFISCFVCMLDIVVIVVDWFGLVLLSLCFELNVCVFTVWLYCSMVVD